MHWFNYSYVQKSMGNLTLPLLRTVLKLPRECLENAWGSLGMPGETLGNAWGMPGACLGMIFAYFRPNYVLTKIIHSIKVY